MQGLKSYHHFSQNTFSCPTNPLKKSTNLSVMTGGPQTKQRVAFLSAPTADSRSPSSIRRLRVFGTVESFSVVSSRPVMKCSRFICPASDASMSWRRLKKRMLSALGVDADGAFVVYRNVIFGILALEAELWICESIDIRGLKSHRLVFHLLLAISNTQQHKRTSYFIPTPPATKTTFSTSLVATPEGGHTKLPPTRTFSSSPMTLSGFCQSQAAGGLTGDFWIASSRNGLLFSTECGEASSGVEVMVKPPALGIDGTNTSSHCPARNFTSVLMV
jgi:hypothetical protein